MTARRRCRIVVPMTKTTTLQKKSIETPDEVRTVPKGRIDIVELGPVTFSRTVFEPGWRWAESVKPVAGTDSCEFPHAVYVVSGSLRVRMDDGSELDLGPGDVAVVPPGHDAWVTSDEPCVTYDFGSEDADYAKPPS
jgi:hypothetical protein